MSTIIIPKERQDAWDRYERKFGKEYPEYDIYMKYGDDWQAEVADINRRIKENDPAPERGLPDGVVV